VGGDIGIVSLGGDTTIRYSHVSDVSTHTLSLHTRSATVEYNWLVRPGQYSVYVGPCEYYCGGTGTNGVTATATFRGNVVVQSPSQSNPNHLTGFAGAWASTDSTGKVNRIQLAFIANTFVGFGGSSAAVFAASETTIAHDAVFHNNVLYSLASAVRTFNTATITLSGRNNWATSGTIMGALTGTVFGGDPGFVDTAGQDFRPAVGSPLRAQAASAGQVTPVAVPNKEYYLNEALPALYRDRAATSDIGAFEYGNTGTIVGPNGPIAQPDAGVDAGSGGGTDAGSPSDAGSSNDAGTSADGGTTSPGPADSGSLAGPTGIDAGFGSANLQGRDEQWNLNVGCSSVAPNLLGVLAVALLARALRRRR
jgi:hypothetical protein